MGWRKERRTGERKGHHAHPLGFLRRRQVAPGARPGIDHLPEAEAPPEQGKVTITCVDYGPDLHAVTEVDDLEGFLAAPRPAGGAVRWLNVDGLHPFVIRRLRAAFDFHPLAAEDVLHTNQRPKVEPYDDHLFLVARMLDGEQRPPRVEQLSMILFEDALLTFQERPGDVFGRVRERISAGDSRFRKLGPAYLVYALLDAVVDHFFPVLEHYGDALDDIEGGVLERPRRAELRQLYRLKQELVLLRRVIWPLRQAIDELHRSERKELQPVHTYLRDVVDHAFQVMDIVEAYRDTASSLTDLYMSSMANRMNEVMKVLTILASLFIPVTFLAGVYGMNFEHIPELGWRWAYPAFWVVCIVVTAALILYFRHVGWIGEPRDED